MSLCFDVCRLIMSTSAELSVTKQMHLFAIERPQICKAMTMGQNSRKVIFKEPHESGHEPENHVLPNTAP